MKTSPNDIIFLLTGDRISEATLLMIPPWNYFFLLFDKHIFSHAEFPAMTLNPYTYVYRRLLAIMYFDETDD
jgi:hypothetical protein